MTVQGDHQRVGGLTELKRQRLGFREAKVASICKAKYQREGHCSLSSRELQGGI